MKKSNRIPTSLLRKLVFSRRIFYTFIIYGLSISIGLGISALPIVIMGANPLEAYWTMFYASLGGVSQIAETLVKAIPLWLAGLSVAVAFSVGFWNIGAEGQLHWGAIATTGVGIALASLALPSPIAILIVLASGLIAGTFWALIPAFLKAYLRINEIIVTVMMNFIAIYFTEYLILGPWRDPTAPEPMTPPIASAAQLPKLIPRTWFHSGIFVAIAATVVVFFIMEKTPLGYEIKCTGNNPKAAKWGGIDVSRVIIYSMILSGGLAGLAGACEIAGVHYRLLRGFSPGYGFLAIIVALLAKLNPIGVAFAAFFFAALLVGADALQRTIGMPVSAVYVIEATILLSVFVFENIIRRRIET